MFAVFQTGGKQYKVQVGDEIYVEKLNLPEGTQVAFKDVFMVDNEVGLPFLPKARVFAKILKHGKQKKILVVKFKSKKHHYKRQGHRQPYTKLVIEKIDTNFSE